MVESTNSLAQVKADLTALAQKHIDAYETYDVKYTGTKFELEAR